MIQLIPGSDVAASTEAFAIDQKKASWTPAPAHLRSKSFPTPFAQAEMMAHVLGLLSLDPGVPPAQPENVNDRLQQTFERWRLLLLGVVLGEVLIETVDLRSLETDNFGAMLVDLRPEVRFLGLLRDARRMGSEGRRLLVGATDPQCLFWCSPRVARDNYWGELKTRIDASATRGEALKLLADWRATLERNGVWAPGNEHAPAWMKALQVLLGETRPSPDLSSLAQEARFVGPLRLSVVPRSTNDPDSLILYLPVREPGWASRFSELLFFQPARRDAGTVDLTDPNGRVVATIRMAPREASEQHAGVRTSIAVDVASTAGHELLAGVGRIDGNPNIARSHGQAHWLEDHANAPGYRSLVFNPLLAAAGRSHGKTAVTDADVQSFPTLYPDAIRLVVTQPDTELPGGTRIQLSRDVTNALTAGVRAPQTGVLPGRWEPGAPLPRILAVPGSSGTLAPGLVECFGPAQKVVDVGEVRGLGFALWLYFVGEAELRPDGAKVLWTADEGKELFGRVVVNQVERPLEVLKDALLAVRGEGEQRRAAARLATLQRFRMTWRSVGEGDGERPEVQATRLGRIAAETFLEWVMGPRPIGSFGLKAAAPREFFNLSERVRLPLFLDELAKWE